MSIKVSLSRVPWSSSGSRDLLTVVVGENAKVELELYVDRGKLPNAVSIVKSPLNRLKISQK